MHAEALKPVLVKYAVNAKLFRLGSTNPKKNFQTLDAFWWGTKPPHQKIKKLNFIFQKCFNI